MAAPSLLWFAAAAATLLCYCRPTDQYNFTTNAVANTNTTTTLVADALDSQRQPLNLDSDTPPQVPTPTIPTSFTTRRTSSREKLPPRRATKDPSKGLADDEGAGTDESSLGMIPNKFTTYSLIGDENIAKGQNTFNKQGGAKDLTVGKAHSSAADGSFEVVGSRAEARSAAVTKSDGKVRFGEEHIQKNGERFLTTGNPSVENVAFEYSGAASKISTEAGNSREEIGNLPIIDLGNKRSFFNSSNESTSTHINSTSDRVDEGKLLADTVKLGQKPLVSLEQNTEANFPEERLQNQAIFAENLSPPHTIDLYENISTTSAFGKYIFTGKEGTEIYANANSSMESSENQLSNENLSLKQPDDSQDEQRKHSAKTFSPKKSLFETSSKSPKSISTTSASEKLSSYENQAIQTRKHAKQFMENSEKQPYNINPTAKTFNFQEKVTNRKKPSDSNSNVSPINVHVTVPPVESASETEQRPLDDNLTRKQRPSNNTITFKLDATPNKMRDATRSGNTNAVQITVSKPDVPQDETSTTGSATGNKRDITQEEQPRGTPEHKKLVSKIDDGPLSEDVISSSKSQTREIASQRATPRGQKREMSFQERERRTDQPVRGSAQRHRTTKNTARLAAAEGGVRHENEKANDKPPVESTVSNVPSQPGVTRTSPVDVASILNSHEYQSLPLSGENDSKGGGSAVNKADGKNTNGPTTKVSLLSAPTSLTTAEGNGRVTGDNNNSNGNGENKSYSFVGDDRAMGAEFEKDVKAIGKHEDVEFKKPTQGSDAEVERVYGNFDFEDALRDGIVAGPDVAHAVGDSSHFGGIKMLDSNTKLSKDELDGGAEISNMQQGLDGNATVGNLSKKDDLAMNEEFKEVFKPLSTDLAAKDLLGGVVQRNTSFEISETGPSDKDDTNRSVDETDVKSGAYLSNKAFASGITESVVEKTLGDKVANVSEIFYLDRTVLKLPAGDFEAENSRGEILQERKTTDTSPSVAANLSKMLISETANYSNKSHANLSKEEFSNKSTKNVQHNSNRNTLNVSQNFNFDNNKDLKPPSSGNSTISKILPGEFLQEKESTLSPPNAEASGFEVENNSLTKRLSDSKTIVNQSMENSKESRMYSNLSSSPSANGTAQVFDQVHSHPETNASLKELYNSSSLSPSSLDIKNVSYPVDLYESNALSDLDTLSTEVAFTDDVQLDGNSTYSISLKGEAAVERGIANDSDLANSSENAASFANASEERINREAFHDNDRNGSRIVKNQPSERKSKGNKNKPDNITHIPDDFVKVLYISKKNGLPAENTSYSISSKNKAAEESATVSNLAKNSSSLPNKPTSTENITQKLLQENAETHLVNPVEYRQTHAAGSLSNKQPSNKKKNGKENAMQLSLNNREPGRSHINKRVDKKSYTSPTRNIDHPSEVTQEPIQAYVNATRGIEYTNNKNSKTNKNSSMNSEEDINIPTVKPITLQEREETINVTSERKNFTLSVETSNTTAAPPSGGPYNGLAAPCGENCTRDAATLGIQATTAAAITTKTEESTPNKEILIATKEMGLQREELATKLLNTTKGNFIQAETLLPTEKSVLPTKNTAFPTYATPKMPSSTFLYPATSANIPPTIPTTRATQSSVGSGLGSGFGFFSVPTGRSTLPTLTQSVTAGDSDSEDADSANDTATTAVWPVKMAAVVEGDLVLGGLMMVHEREDTVTCGPVMPQGGVQALEAMLYTLDRLNMSPDLLPNITIGAHILDDCDKDTYGLEMAVDFIKGSISNIDDSEYYCNKTQVRKVISGVVGAASSVTSIQVANLLRLFKIPQVSFFSTSPELSNKQRFEYFTRTIPSDHYQVKAMVDIVRLMGWSYVSILYEESNYGIKAFEELEELLGVHNICIAVKEKLVKDSGVAEEIVYDSIVQKLLTKPRARGAIIFGSDQEVAGVMRAVRRSNATGSFSWIGSDGWSARALVSDGNEAEVEGTLSVQPQANPVRGFKDYFLNLTVENNRRNPWFVEFWEDQFQCRYPNSSKTPYNQKYTRFCTGRETLTKQNTVFEDQLQFVSDAVLAFAYAIRDMHHDVCHGKSGLCDAMKPTKGTELLKYLKKVNFQGLSGDRFHFDSNGDGPARYNIIHFKQISPGKYSWVRVGEYLEGELKLNMSEIQFKLGQPKPPESVCSLPCEMGQAKKYVEGESCCWHCFNCTQYQIRHPTDPTRCETCPQGTVPDTKHITCLDIPEEFLRPGSGWAIGAMALSSIGILMTAFVGSVFIRHNDTPVVRASGRELSYVLLAGILMCYCVTYLLVLRPTDVVCGVQRFGAGFCFTVVYAALLTKTNRISRIFNAGKRSAKRPSFISPRSQLIICTFLVAVQLLINGVWMLVSPPRAMHHYPTREDNLLVCSSYIDASYMIAFMYPIFLIVICTLYAVLTRKIPEAFNESKYIGFTMYTTCVIWLAFVPLYFGTANHVAMRITSMSVTISLSASVTLVCLFSPKLYIILIRPERNVRQSMMPARYSAIKGSGATGSGSMMAAVMVTAATCNQKQTIQKHVPPPPSSDAVISEKEETDLSSSKTRVNMVDCYSQTEPSETIPTSLGSPPVPETNGTAPGTGVAVVQQQNKLNNNCTVAAMVGNGPLPLGT